MSEKMHLKISKKLPASKITEIFEDSEDSGEALERLYTYVFGGLWEHIEFIGSWPVVSEVTNKLIFDKFYEYFPREPFPAGIYINKGFSSGKVSDYKVVYDGDITIISKNEKEVSYVANG